MNTEGRRISESRVRENRMHGLRREGRLSGLLSTLPLFLSNRILDVIDDSRFTLSIAEVFQNEHFFRSTLKILVSRASSGIVEYVVMITVDLFCSRYSTFHSCQLYPPRFCAKYSAYCLPVSSITVPLPKCAFNSTRNSFESFLARRSNPGFSRGISSTL